MPITPGKWRAGYESESDQKKKMLVRAEEIEGQPYVAICPRTYDTDHIANARAIAALPMLLDVCRAYIRDYEDTFIDPDEMTGESKDLYAKAKAALAVALERNDAC